MKNYRLYLVRHGVTQGNLDGIYMGSGTDQPLCAQGAAQLEDPMSRRLAQLTQLAELKEAGVLTNAEFEAKKALILHG